MKFLIAQLLISLIFIVFIISLFYKVRRKSKSLVLGLSIVALIASVVAGNIINILPAPKDTIQLVATGEKNPAAFSNEVSLKAIVVDGKQYRIENAVEGKWFWQGDSYMWRNENDSRKPEGVTRLILLKIPKGNDRQLIFDNTQWSGFVEILCNNESQICDLYNEQGSDVNVTVPGNGILTAYLIKVGKLILYALLIFALLSYFIFAMLKFDDNTIKRWFGRNWDKLFYATLSITYLFVLQHVSAKGSLWYDEVWQLGWYYTGEWPREQTTIFTVIFSLWTKLMPYGQEYLRLLSQLFIAGAVYLSGLIGATYKSKRLGVLLSSIVACSGSIMYQCSLGIRDYAMMFFSVTLMIYMFVRKQNSKDNPKFTEMLLYGVTIAFAMDVHMMNVMVAGLLLIADLILIVKHKASRKCWGEFIFPAIYGVYWIINIIPGFLISNGSNGYMSWVEQISIGRIWDLIKWIYSYNNILLFVAITGFIFIFSKMVLHILERRFDFNSDFILITIALIPIIQIFLISAYSFYHSSNGSMLIDRYFVSSFICMYFVLAVGFEYIFNLVDQSLELKKVNIFTIATLCSLVLYSWTDISPWNPWSRMYRSTNQDFKSAIDYVMAQNDCYSPSTLFIIDAQNEHNSGIQYYTTHGGKKDDILHCSMWSLPENLKEYSNIYVSCACGADTANTQLNQILDENYTFANYDADAGVKKYIRILDG